jgi:hypothetical protein
VGVFKLRSSIRGPSVLREAALFLVRGPAERRGESGDGGSPPVLSGFLSGSVCLPLALPLAPPDLVDMDMICYYCSPLAGWNFVAGGERDIASLLSSVQGDVRQRLWSVSVGGKWTRQSSLSWS